MTERFDVRRVAAWLAAAALAVAALVAAGPAAGQALAGTCANADAGIDEATAKQLAKAARCLINEDRAGRDLRRLDSNGKLDEAAGKHNRTMLKQNCWSHDCPGEPDLERRIRNTGYLGGARKWRFAEVFGCDVTAEAMLDEWLASKPTRKRIRDRGYRDIGIAAARAQVVRSNCDGGNEVTYTVVMAKRRG
jgi:uncharacterized protein YkwD